MRAFSRYFLWSVLTLYVSSNSVFAQEYSSVPATTEQIADDVLRNALVHYSPNYNYLPRSEQVRAYVNIYQALHGAQPALTSLDSAYLTQEAYPVTVEPRTYYYTPPPAHYRPSRPGFSIGISLGNDRWNRPGWNRPGSGHRPPPHFGPGGHHGGPGRPHHPRH